MAMKPLEEIEADKSFAQLTYNQQAQVRMAYMRQYVAENPAEFAGMRFMDWHRLNEAMLQRAPVLESQDAKAMELMNTANGIVSGDQAAINQGVGIFLGKRVEEEAGIAGWVVKNISRLFGAQMYEDAEDPVVKSDRAKAYDYFMGTVRSNSATASGIAGAADVVLPIAGVAMDILLTRGATSLALKGASLVAPQAAARATSWLSGADNFSKAFTGGSGNRLIHWFMTKGAPELAKSAMDGATITISNIIDEDYLAKLRNQPEIERTLPQLLLTYGQEVAMDYLFFLGVQGAAPILRGAKQSIGSFKDLAKGRTIIQKGLETADVDSVIAGLARGDLSDEALSMLTPEARAAYKYDRNVRFIEAEAGSFTPDGYNSILAGHKGFNLRPVGRAYENALDEVNKSLDAMRVARRNEIAKIESARAEVGDLETNKAIRGVNAEFSQGAERLQEQLKAVKPEGYKLTDIRDGKPKEIGVFTSSDDATAQMFRYVDGELEALARQAGTVTPDSVLSVKSIYKSEAPVAPSTLGTFRTLMSGVVERGTVHSSGALAFARRALKEAGVDDSLVSGLKVRKVATETWQKMGNIITDDGYLNIPHRVGLGTDADEVILGARLGEALASYAKKGGDLSSEATAFLKGIANEASAYGTKRGATAAFIKTQAQQLYPGSSIQRANNGTITLTTQAGQKFTFSGHGSFAEHLYAKYARDLGFGDDMVRDVTEFARREYGIEIKRTKFDTGVERYVARKSGRVIDTASSIGKLVDANPYLMPKLPISMAPDLSIVRPGVQSIEVIGRNFLGSYKDVLENLRNYKPKSTPNKSTVISSNSDRTISFDKDNLVYELSIPNLGWKGEFSSKSELESFIKKGVNNNEVLGYIASQKGAQVRWGNGGWIVRTIDGKTMLAHNIDELKAAVKDLPDNINYGKDLLNLSPELNAYVEKELRDLYKDQGREFFGYTQDVVDDYIVRNGYRRRGPDGQPKPREGWLNFSAVTRLRPEVVRDIATQYGKPQLATLLTNFENGRRLASGRATEVSASLKKLWGRISDNERVRLVPLLQYSPEQWDTVWTNLQKGVPAGEQMALTATMKDVMMQHRRLLTALGKTFGVDVVKFQQDYLPRIREFVLNQKDQIKAGFAVSTDPDNYLGNLMQKNFASREVQFFSDNLRLNELAEYVATTDPVDITMSYLKQGFRKLYMSKPYEHFATFVKTADDVPVLYRKEMYSYLTDSMGWSEDLTQEALNATVDQFMTTMTKKGFVSGSLDENKKIAKSFTELSSKLVFASTQAGRPFIIARNLLDLYTKGPMYVGMDAIQEGARRFTKAMNDDPFTTVKTLVQAGIIRENMTHFMQATIGKSAVDKFNKVAGAPVFNTDTINRGVMHYAVNAVWDRASAKIAGALKSDNPMAIKKAVDWLELDALNEADVREVFRLYREQGETAARTYHATRVNELTQFTYESVNNPRMFQGAIGRFFGQYGHYPVSYVETIRQMFANRRGASLLKGVVRLASTTAALGLAFEKGLGFNASQFYPWGQMLFSGGPHFQLMLTGIDALDVNSPTGARSRANILQEIASVTVPGALLAKGMLQAGDLAQKGDFWGFMSKMLSAPYVGFDR